jgi:hypothetical protein
MLPILAAQEAIVRLLLAKVGALLDAGGDAEPRIDRHSEWWRLERRPTVAWESRILGWFTGPLPPKGASALEQLRFVRRASGRAMLFYGPILVVLLAVGTST